MTVAWTHPVEFVRIVARLIPKDVEVTATNIRAERMSSSELEALIEQYRGVARDPLEEKEDPEGVLSVARLYSVEPADIQMNAFSVAFGGKADIVLTLSAEMFGRMCALVQCYRRLAKRRPLQATILRGATKVLTVQTVATKTPAERSCGALRSVP